jgi:hypothetical protein
MKLLAVPTVGQIATNVPGPSHYERGTYTMVSGENVLRMMFGLMGAERQATVGYYIKRSFMSCTFQRNIVKMIKSRMERIGHVAVTREIELLRIYGNFGVRERIISTISYKRFS